RGFSGAVMVLLLAAAGWHRAPDDRFDHARHARVFPSCLGCHVGAAEPGRALFPEPATCASCHDGTVQSTVAWRTPKEYPTNLRFSHDRHPVRLTAAPTGDTLLTCGSCHQAERDGWMQVTRPGSETCLACHAPAADHLALPDSACATCHLSLANAPRLTTARIGAFPAPPSHRNPDFMAGAGHGTLAGSRSTVSASCATCHARDFCASCHVNATRVSVIQAMAPDQRSLAIKTELKAPVSHADRAFQLKHGDLSRAKAATCSTCHTQESCIACHRAQPGVASKLIAAAPGQAQGAHIVRRPPASHLEGFADAHGTAASARPSSCAACHARTECLDCHRPAAGSSGAYHRAGFLTTHPSAAFNRQSDCAECHNTQQFCTSCHAKSGLTSARGLQGGYHDANRSFLLQHGPTARRALESCVTCHTERDCLACHSSQTRRFNPHGPGFDAERLRRRNPQTCSACHGQNIPGR
ncbi:MAG TPA: hypothetical protein VG817_11475, partial [Gemmatimonadales bacterium]|nr:hypothetical protein [Gemmatimonadales bacterium]